MAEGEELFFDFPEDSDTIERKYNRAIIETINIRYSFISKYIFHKNGKVDKQSNQWRRQR